MARRHDSPSARLDVGQIPKIFLPDESLNLILKHPTFYRRVIVDLMELVVFVIAARFLQLSILGGGGPLKLYLILGGEINCGDILVQVKVTVIPELVLRVGL